MDGNRMVCVGISSNHFHPFLETNTLLDTEGTKYLNKYFRVEGCMIRRWYLRLFLFP